MAPPAYAARSVPVAADQSPQLLGHKSGVGLFGGQASSLNEVARLGTHIFKKRRHEPAAKYFKYSGLLVKDNAVSLTSKQFKVSLEHVHPTAHLTGDLRQDAFGDQRFNERVGGWRADLQRLRKLGR